MILLIKSILNIIKLFILFILFILFFPFYEEKAIYLFLKFSGPVFIKLGQFLSVRPDIMGTELSELLSKFQDNCKPFSANKAVNYIENIYKIKEEEIKHIMKLNLKKGSYRLWRIRVNARSRRQKECVGRDYA